MVAPKLTPEERAYLSAPHLGDDTFVYEENNRALSDELGRKGCLVPSGGRCVLVETGATVETDDGPGRVVILKSFMIITDLGRKALAASDA